MGTIVKCGRCGSTEFDLREFDTMMVLSPDLALFGLSCPRCSTQVSALCVIPPHLYPVVREAALDVGAGMGKSASNR